MSPRAHMRKGGKLGAEHETFRRAGRWRQNTTYSYHRIQGSSRLSSWTRVRGSRRGCDGSGGVSDIVLTRDDISSSGGVSKPLRLLLSPENALGSLKRLYERPKPNSCASSMRHLRAICCNRSTEHLISLGFTTDLSSIAANAARLRSLKGDLVDLKTRCAS